MALLPRPNGTEAATCEHLKSAISKERNILKRRALFAQAVDICQDDAQLRLQYGYELERYRKYEEALVQYRKALELDPGIAKTYCNMGDIYMSLKQYAEAIKAYEQGLILDPGNTRVKKNLEASKKALQAR